MPKTFECHCGEKFTGHQQYQTHQLQCDLYRCLCGQIFHNVEDFQQHVAQCKKSALPSSVNDEDDASNSSYSVATALSSRRDSTSSQSTISSQSSQKSYTKCPLCTKDYRTKKNLTQHKTEAHTIEVIKTHPDGHNILARAYVCPICSHRVSSWPSLTRHFDIIHKKKKNIEYCPICRTKGFWESQYLLEHLRKAHGLPKLDGQAGGFQEC